MKEEFLKDKWLWQLTCSDLLEILKESGVISETSKDGEEKGTLPSEKHHVYGLAGLSKLLGCSRATAQRIKSSGVLDEAISQNGKIIVVDADLALDILKVSNNKWGRKKSK